MSCPLPAAPVERWRQDPVEAARYALRHSQYAWIPDYLLAAVAEAVLATFDEVATVTHGVWPELWDSDTNAREWIPADLRRRLMAEIADRGMVPVCLPVETVERGAPPEVAPTFDHPGRVIVRLTVPCRRPRPVAVSGG